MGFLGLVWQCPRIGRWVLLTVLLGAATGAGCPVAALGPAVNVDQPVQFVDRSIFLPHSWAWDFDYTGGTPTIDSTAQNPVWKFRLAGTHQVRLEVCNVVGCGVRIQEIHVVGPPPLFVDDFESGTFLSWSRSFSTP